MSKRITRRNWIKLVGGSAVGLMITPIPWKILDETAKWSQNWSWIPVPRNGKINFRNTTCTLCPMACGVRTRCVDNQPVSLTGIPDHPISGGGLCSIGLGGHLLPYHPSRLLQPYKVLHNSNGTNSVPVSSEESISAIIGAISSSRQGSVAILDGQPKRTISFAYRKFLAGLADGLYVIPPTTHGVSTELIKNVIGEKETSFGFDIENARTILSFGAPVLDGWGTLGQFSRVVKNRSGKDHVKIIQVESIHSRTAQLADEWVPVKPGTEAAFVLAIADVMIEERLCDIQKLKAHSKDFDNNSSVSFTELVKKFSSANVSGQMGIPAERIREIARDLASRKPSLVVFDGSSFSRDEQIAFMDLNILLGAVNTKGGLIPRTGLPAPLEEKLAEETSLIDVPDHSIRVLILDGAESGSAFPWQMLEQKLVTNDPMVVSLSPYFTGIARYADYLIPSPTYLESYGDSPTPPTVSMASYSISRPILVTPNEVVEPLDVIRRIARDTDNEFPQLETLLKSRVTKIFRERKGFVFDATSGKTARLSDISSAEQLTQILSHGGCWYEDKVMSRSKEIPTRFQFLGGDDHGFEKLSAATTRNSDGPGLVLLPYAATVAQPHQLMEKLDRESDLRESGNTASINPETASRFSLSDGNRATLKTEIGITDIKVKLDKAVMPGIIQATVGSDETNILEICKIENDSTWRITKAEILPA
ncbi:MAG TPA: molybdopterin dinucleotide binding domain-containing protein [Candidatus Acidoferrales bacterium]|nr:molybdopterin dinucleotide binding domain-containing protein [Candidatus Acidoferrales bacterium]